MPPDVTSVPAMPALEPSPAGQAIGMASGVVLAATVIYLGTAAADALPELMLAAIGAVLGAGVAINAIVARDLDRSIPPWPDGWQPRLAGVPLRGARARLGVIVGLHLAVVGVAAAVQTAGVREDWRWLLVANGCAVAWWALTRALVDVAAPPEPVDGPTAPARSYDGASVFALAFVLAAVTFAVVLLYAAIAADTPWLPSPRLWDHYQGVLWFVLLEFVALPLALVARRPRA